MYHQEILFAWVTCPLTHLYIFNNIISFILNFESKLCSYTLGSLSTGLMTEENRVTILSKTIGWGSVLADQRILLYGRQLDLLFSFLIRKRKLEWLVTEHVLEFIRVHQWQKCKMAETKLDYNYAYFLSSKFHSYLDHLGFNSWKSFVIGKCISTFTINLI